MAQLVPIQLLLPLQIDVLLNSGPKFGIPNPETDWIPTVMAFGAISAIAGACALIAYPVTGAISDRTVSRFGRRRPWIFIGTLIFAFSLAFLGVQTDLVGIAITWSLALIGFCMLTAALTATISDQVPVEQRGFVSGWVSAPQAGGVVLGLLLVTTMGLSVLVGYLAMAIAVIVLVIPFLLFMPDEVMPKVLRPKLSFGKLLAGFWINPIKHPDFGWTLTGRVLVNLGNALGTTLLLYFIMFGLDRPDTAQDDLLLLTVVYLIFFTIAALGGGKLSDKIGQRKPFIYAAAFLQALAALLLAFIPDFSIAAIGAGLLGLGYGCFMSVDQALATQVLPDAFSRGKDLGIMNVAAAVPQAVAPLLGALFISAFIGFTGLFLASAIAAILGGLAVVRIKSVK